MIPLVHWYKPPCTVYDYNHSYRRKPKKPQYPPIPRPNLREVGIEYHDFEMANCRPEKRASNALGTEQLLWQ